MFKLKVSCASLSLLHFTHSSAEISLRLLSVGGILLAHACLARAQQVALLTAAVLHAYASACQWLTAVAVRMLSTSCACLRYWVDRHSAAFPCLCAPVAGRRRGPCAELGLCLCLQHVEVLAFTCTTVSTLAAVIHYISVNVIRTVGEGHLCDPADHTCEQNFNLIVIT